MISVFFFLPINKIYAFSELFLIPRINAAVLTNEEITLKIVEEIYDSLNLEISYNDTSKIIRYNTLSNEGSVKYFSQIGSRPDKYEVN